MKKLKQLQIITKIAITIKKGFDGVSKSDEEESKYDTKDIQKIYQNVIKKITKDYYNQLYANKFSNLDEMNKFLERHKLLNCFKKKLKI